ncbi:lipoteichoic acid stability factor AuxB [Staphylococcus felis]|uniref:lipoteichoic acid stability factor AuxB n=1 Tax=Staphylococcus felis TaxID=46127 RepID=UPI000E2464CB|nr:DUF4064 domain-containing protein [Staphylococcus felis]REH82287.1 hypothetical protein DOS61_09515 [Staphylococcus felis]
MARDAYTQIRRPLNRLAEKILGWLSWILILATTVVAMFFGLVLFSNENSIQNLENAIANNSFFQEVLTNNNMTSTQLVIMFQNGVWAFIVYLIICLLISFLALISMNYRIVSGLLFLLATVITLPLFFILVPLFFFIVAMMMFIRRDKVDWVPAYHQPIYDYEEKPISKQYEHSHYDEEPVNRHQDKVTSETTHEAQPEILSRTAKYNHKVTKSKDTPEHSDENHNENPYSTEQFNDSVPSFEGERDAYDSSDNKPYHENEYVTQDTRYEATQPLKDEQKEQRKAEKARLKEERKEKKKQQKEERKKRPSATIQRRKNFENRLKIQQERANEDKSNK